MPPKLLSGSSNTTELVLVIQHDELLKLIYSGVSPLKVISSPAASTLYLEQKQTEFSLNVSNDSNDTYFHFESPVQLA
jgi:hypothetical protein